MVINATQMYLYEFSIDATSTAVERSPAISGGTVRQCRPIEVLQLVNKKISQKKWSDFFTHLFF